MVILPERVQDKGELVDKNQIAAEQSIAALRFSSSDRLAIHLARCKAAANALIRQ